MLREEIVDDSQETRTAILLMVLGVELVMTSLSQSSTLLGAPSPLSLTLQLVVSAQMASLMHR